MFNLHPFIIHFPIALLLTAVFCELIGHFTKSDLWRRRAFVLLLLGLPGAAAGIISGLFTESQILHNDAAHEIMELHKKIMIVASFLFAVSFSIRLKFREIMSRFIQIIYFTLLIISSGLLIFGAHNGGILVYELGVGVQQVKPSPEKTGNDKQTDHKKKHDHEHQH